MFGDLETNVRSRWRMGEGKAPPVVSVNMWTAGETPTVVMSLVVFRLPRTVRIEIKSCK